MALLQRWSCLLVGATLIIIAPACNKSSSSATSKASVDTGGSIKDRENNAVTALAIVRDINLGTANGDAFTNEFKAILAEPRTDEDRKHGHSAQAFRDELATLKGKLPDADWQPAARALLMKGTRHATIVDAKAMPPRVILLCTDGAGSGVKLDWMQVSRKVGEWPADNASAECWTAVAFLSALFDTDNRFAFALLSPAYRASLAPVFSKADEARGYNPGTLAEKLKTLRGSATTFGITRVDVDTVNGSLIAPSGPRAFIMKLTNGPHAGERLVESFTTE